MALLTRFGLISYWRPELSYSCADGNKILNPFHFAHLAIPPRGITPPTAKDSKIKRIILVHCKIYRKRVDASTVQAFVLRIRISAFLASGAHSQPGAPLLEALQGARQTTRVLHGWWVWGQFLKKASLSVLCHCVVSVCMHVPVLVHLKVHVAACVVCVQMC